MKRKEFFYGPIICFFDVLGKITGRQLVLTPMVSHALTADPFAMAGVIGAIAALFVDLSLAFHLGHCQGTWLASQVPIFLFLYLIEKSGR